MDKKKKERETKRERGRRVLWVRKMDFFIKQVFIRFA